MPDINEEQGKYVFSLAPITVNQQIEGEKKRTFEGTAYGGGRVVDHWYWGANGVVFDLDGIDIPNPTPLLEEHFGSSRIGVVKEVQLNQNIQVKGHFLSNPAAKQIVEDSDNEFPFQMSLYIIPGTVEEVGQGRGNNNMLNNTALIVFIGLAAGMIVGGFYDSFFNFVEQNIAKFLSQISVIKKIYRLISILLACFLTFLFFMGFVAQRFEMQSAPN